MTTSAHSFTTAAKVESRLKGHNTSIVDTDIEIYITHAEGLVIAVSKHIWIATGNATIPELVEKVTTDLAALQLLAYDPSGFSSLAEAAFIADILWASSRRDLNFLADDRFVKRLRGEHGQ